ncbi:MAG TPA: hypothetical protein VHQ68_13740 [Propionibacteriaceae bacterium]|nr:hypothetical protein [Propionibacteriaceae bacterium]
MASIVAAGRSTARDRYGPACRRQPNTQVPVGWRPSGPARESVEDSGRRADRHDTEADEMKGCLRGLGYLEESWTWVPGRFAGPPTMPT